MPSASSSDGLGGEASSAAIAIARGEGHLRHMEAIKACGVVVHMSPDQFLSILLGVETPLVVTAFVRGVFGSNYHDYLTSVRGLAFYTWSREPLKFPGPVDLIQAKKITTPQF